MMKQNPLVSIIVPVYNVEPYLGRCIESIINQTYEEIQIIIIDDGSADNSGSVCDEFALQDSRIEVYHTANGGLVAARKEGLSHARGEYVGFVDGDDYVDEEMFENLVENILETKADFVHSCFKENIEEIEKEVILVSDRVIEMTGENDNVDVLVDCFLERNDECFVAPSIWSKLFRRDFILECYSKVPNEQQYGEDVLCLCHGIMNARKVSLMANAFYHYIIRPQSLSHVDIQTRFVKEVGLSHYLIRFGEEYNYNVLLNNKIHEYLQRRMLSIWRGNEQMKIPIPKFYYGNVEKLQGKSIVLYGAGRVGKDYYAQICKYQDCRIMAWTDREWKTIHLEYAEIIDPDVALKMEYDTVLIAIENEKTAKNIKDYLQEIGVDEAKIVWEEPMKY